MKRKLGMNVSAVSGQDPLDMLDLIKKLGFETYFLDACTKETAKAVKEKGDALGLTCEFIHAPFKGINNMWLPGMEYLTVYNAMKYSIDAAAENNIPAVIIHLSSGWKSPQVCDLGLERFDSLVFYAAERGVTLAFENLRKVGNLACIVDRYEKFDNVRFCYDCGHEYGYTETVCWMDIFRKKCICTHIHDNLGRGEIEDADPDLHYLPFDGTLDYKKMIAKLDEHGYEGSLMLEVFNTTKPEYQELTPEEFVTTCYERLQKIASYSN